MSAFLETRSPIQLLHRIYQWDKYGEALIELLNTAIGF